MAPAPIDNSSSRAWWIALLALFGGIPMLIGFSVLFWYTGRQARAQAQLDRVTADLQASGMPIDDRSLAAVYEARTDRRRTAQWLGILDQLDSPSFTQAAQAMPFLGSAGPQDVPLPGQRWDQRQAVETFLQSHQALLDDVHDAASDPAAVWFPIQFDSFHTLLPHIQSSRSAARLLMLEHHAAVYAGDGERAAQSLRSLLGLADTLRGQPFLVSQLVRMAIHGMALGALQRSLEHDLLDEPALTDLLERLGAFDDFQTPHQMAIGDERAMALPVFQQPQRLGEAGEYVPYPLLGSRALDALAALDFYERMASVAEEDDLDAYVEAAAQWTEEIRAEFTAAGMLQRFDTMITSMLLPAMDAFAYAVARQVMHNRLAQLGVGVRLHRQRFGEWPQRLDDLGPLGIDPTHLVPLGGKPFGYRVDEGTALLWGFDPTPRRDATAREVPDDPPPLEDPDQPNNAMWFWRLTSEVP